MFGNNNSVSIFDKNWNKIVNIPVANPALMDWDSDNHLIAISSTSLTKHWSLQRILIHREFRSFHTIVLNILLHWSNTKNQVKAKNWLICRMLDMLAVSSYYAKLSSECGPCPRKFVRKFWRKLYNFTCELTSSIIQHQCWRTQTCIRTCAESDWHWNSAFNWSLAWNDDCKRLWVTCSASWRKDLHSAWKLQVCNRVPSESPSFTAEWMDLRT